MEQGRQHTGEVFQQPDEGIRGLGGHWVMSQELKQAVGKVKWARLKQEVCTCNKHALLGLVGEH